MIFCEYFSLFNDANRKVFFRLGNLKMTTWSRIQKLAAIAVGAGGGVAIYLYTAKKENASVYNSWTTNVVVPDDAKWDFNWDQ